MVGWCPLLVAVSAFFVSSFAFVAASVCGRDVWGSAEQTGASLFAATNERIAAMDSSSSIASASANARSRSGWLKFKILSRTSPVSSVTNKYK